MKEEFCGICAGIPLAIAGATGTKVSSKKKGMLWWSSIILTIISFIMIIIYLFKCKKCK